MITFRSVGDALRAGWTIYDRTADGYLIKQRTGEGWQLGQIVIPQEAKRESA